MYGHLNVIEYLVGLGSQINPDWKNAPNILYPVCKYKFCNVLEFLLNHGADVNQPIKEKFFTCQPIHIASMFGSTEMVSLLLKHGASIDSIDSNNQIFHIMKHHCSMHLVMVSSMS